MPGSVVSRSGGTPAIESPGNAEAWLRTRPSAALAKPARDEVHVWRVDVRSAYAHSDDLWRVLARDERQKATELFFEGDRKRFVVSRGVLRVLLGRYLRVQPGSLV